MKAKGNPVCLFDAGAKGNPVCPRKGNPVCPNTIDHSAKLHRLNQVSAVTDAGTVARGFGGRASRAPIPKRSRSPSPRGFFSSAFGAFLCVANLATYAVIPALLKREKYIRER